MRNQAQIIQKSTPDISYTYSSFTRVGGIVFTICKIFDKNTNHHLHYPQSPGFATIKNVNLYHTNQHLRNI